MFSNGITRNYYKSILQKLNKIGCQGALIVFDITSSESFKAIPRWVCEMKSFADENIPILIVGNKSDLSQIRKVPQS